MILGSTIAAPAFAPAAAVTDSHWWLTLAFVNARLGAVVEGGGILGAERRERWLHATFDGAAA
ncbi:MAG: hypothetical protein WAL35_02665 [Acidimicrobiales bacterium]